MFNTKDKITLTLVAYGEKGPIKSFSLPKDIDSSFHLPEETFFVEVKEYTEINCDPKLSKITTYYLGKEVDLFKFLQTKAKESKIKVASTITDFKFNKAKRVIIEEKDEEILIKYVLNENDLTFSSLEKMEKHIRRLSIAFNNFEQKVEEVKKLTRSNYE